MKAKLNVKFVDSRKKTYVYRGKVMLIIQMSITFIV